MRYLYWHHNSDVLRLWRRRSRWCFVRRSLLNFSPAVCTKHCFWGKLIVAFLHKLGGIQIKRGAKCWKCSSRISNTKRRYSVILQDQLSQRISCFRVEQGTSSLQSGYYDHKRRSQLWRFPAKPCWWVSSSLRNLLNRPDSWFKQLPYFCIPSSCIVVAEDYQRLLDYSYSFDAVINDSFALEQSLSRKFQL